MRNVLSVGSTAVSHPDHLTQSSFFTNRKAFSSFTERRTHEMLLNQVNGVSVESKKQKELGLSLFSTLSLLSEFLLRHEHRV